MVQKGETPDDVSTDINDEAPDMNAMPTVSSRTPPKKPWEI